MSERVERAILCADKRVHYGHEYLHNDDPERVRTCADAHVEQSWCGGGPHIIATRKIITTAWEGSMSSPTLATVPLSEDQARELSRAAKQVTSWTERRNTLIREAVAAGAGIREVARATGLNVGTVHTMIHGRKR